MSVTGTGTQADPYVVTTWAELVAKAAENGKYVRVGNNIDVLAEYSDGSAPTLVLNSFVDGDGRTISRWYNTGEKYLIRTRNTTCISNTNFTNIKTNYSLIYNLSDGNSNHITIQNCKFAGIMGDGYVFAGTRDTRSGKIDGVAVNIKGGNLFLTFDYAEHSYGNCNIRLETSATGLFDIQTYNSESFYDSYFDITAPNLTDMLVNPNSRHINFDNCVLDIRTNGAVTFDSGNSAISIFNSSHAPNAVGTAGKIVGVDNTHWLDAAYLADTVGFNIVGGE